MVLVCIGVHVRTVFAASTSMTNVADVVILFETVRCPGFGLVFSAVVEYVSAVEYPDFVTVISYPEAAGVPMNCTVPLALVYVMRFTDVLALTMVTSAFEIPAPTESTAF